MGGFHTFLLSLLAAAIALDSARCNPHLAQPASPLMSAVSGAGIADKWAAPSKTLSEIYKRKHNFHPASKLHPSKLDSTAHEKTLAADDFVVLYPETKAKKKEQNAEKEAGDEKAPHLILGLIGSGLYSEANASLELFPGALGSLFNTLSNYISAAYARVSASLHSFFEAIEENIKKSNGLPVLELGDILF